MSDSMPGLAGFQKKFLRGQAHGLSPLVHIGKAGLTAASLAAVDEQLRIHELIKVRFLDPDDKKALARDLASELNAEVAGIVGHVAILFRPSEEKAGEGIRLPSRRDENASK